MTLERELKLAAVISTIVGLYVAAVLAAVPELSPDIFALLRHYGVTALSGALLIGLFALAWVFARDSWACRFKTPARMVMLGVLQRFAAPANLVRYMLPILAWTALLWTLAVFKQAVLPQSGYEWDPLLADLDETLFLGHEPWVVVHDLIGSPTMTSFIDRFYHTFFGVMVVGIYACSLITGAWRARMRYMLTYTLVWVIGGSMMAWAMASVGPCYFDTVGGFGDRFVPLMAELDSHNAWLQANGYPEVNALRLQDMLAANLAEGGFGIGMGISAMPSMHNAFAILFALSLWPISRWLSVLGWVYAFAIWVGSFYLGWHYALDGVLVLPVVVGLWMVCGRIAAWLDRDSSAAVPVAA